MLEWAIRRKEKPDVFYRSMVSLCEGENKKVRVEFELLEEPNAKVAMDQGSVLSPFIPTAKR